MHIVTVEFIANTDDEAVVREAYQPIMDKYAEFEECLGCSLVKTKGRREPRKYMFINMWTDKDAAVAISSRPEVHAAHDIIEKVNSGQSTLNAWGIVSSRKMGTR